MTYDFTLDSGKLVVTLDTESGKFEANIKEYLQPNLVLGTDRIYLKESGRFIQDFIFDEIGTIDGNTADNLIEVFQLLDLAVSQLFSVAIPEYADNATAVAGGLVIGKFYRTGDILKVVHA